MTPKYLSKKLFCGEPHCGEKFQCQYAWSKVIESKFKRSINVDSNDTAATSALADLKTQRSSKKKKVKRTKI